jgi:hypothetical protein
MSPELTKPEDAIVIDIQVRIYKGTEEIVAKSYPFGFSELVPRTPENIEAMLASVNRAVMDECRALGFKNGPNFQL